MSIEEMTMILEALFTYEEDYVDDGDGGTNWTVCYDPKKVSAAIDFLRRSISEMEKRGQDEPVAWMHLKAYGYAPGGYMMTCRDCSNQVIDVDKRALRCRTCAETAYIKDTKPQPSQKPMTPEQFNHMPELFVIPPHHVEMVVRAVEDAHGIKE